MRLNKGQISSIVKAYRDDLVPMIDLAEQYGITRQGIWKMLRKHNIDTTKGSIKVLCDNCGEVVLKRKCEIRSRYHKFCSSPCYHQYFRKYSNLSRQGQRIGRKTVSALFKLKHGNVVHHEDCNDMNNNIVNLRVFKNSSEHISYHRGGLGVPIWQSN